MMFNDLHIEEVCFQKGQQVIKQAGIVIRIGGNHNTGNQRGLPDIVKPDLGGRNIKFLVKPMKDGFDPPALFFEGRAAGQYQFDG